MSMLAEPKRKKKWTLNPRGHLFTNDEDNVGHKLLKKLGWSKGEGLGRDNQGPVEPVRVQYKNDNEGVGYEAKDDKWIAHHDEFSAFLEQLNGNNATAKEPEVIPIKSLEVRSKSSKARVHYHKFTRGKDLSRYSETDLASILGKKRKDGEAKNSDEEIVPVKKRKKDKKEKKEKKENEEKAEQPPSSDSNGKVEHSHGLTTIHGGSIGEYFAAKMASMKAKKAESI